VKILILDVYFCFIMFLLFAVSKFSLGLKFGFKGTVW